MKVIVCGSRDSKKKDLIFKRLNDFHAKTSITHVIEGGQRARDDKGVIDGGVDYWANQWAKDNHIPVSTFYANWKQYGKGAGPIRNIEMLVKGKPEMVIAFPGGSGTESMVREAKRMKVSVTRLA